MSSSIILLLLVGCYASHDVAPANDSLTPERGYERSPPAALGESHAPCAPGADAMVVDVPYGGGPVEVVIELSTRLRAADIFFLTDATGSMGDTLARVQNTVAAPGGLIDEIGSIVPDAWFGGGSYRDFPFGPDRDQADAPFALAVEMSPPDRGLDVRSAFLELEPTGGGDYAESATEALYQSISGAGGRWSSPTNPGTEVSVEPGRCERGEYGAACFREGAKPIVIHFSDICSHNEWNGGNALCSDYAQIEPPPASYDEMIVALRSRGAGYIGIDVAGDYLLPADQERALSPDRFMRQMARDTDCVDVDGRELVYRLPDGGESDAAFASTIAMAVRDLAERVPVDVTAVARDDESDDFDARRMVRAIEPDCGADLPCVITDGGVALDPVAHDERYFYRVIPGSRLRFRATLENTLVVPETERTYGLCIDARTGGTAIADTRSLMLRVGPTRE